MDRPWSGLGSAQEKCFPPLERTNKDATIATIFIFLLASTAGQVDVEDVKGTSLHPAVLIAEGLGKRSI
jgi:hypothetical protein